MSILFGKEADERTKWKILPSTYVRTEGTLRGVKSEPKHVAPIPDEKVDDEETVPATHVPTRGDLINDVISSPEMARQDVVEDQSIWNRFRGGGQNYGKQIERLELLREDMKKKLMYIVLYKGEDRKDKFQRMASLHDAVIEIGHKISKLDKLYQAQLNFPRVECNKVRNDYEKRNVSYEESKTLNRKPYGHERLEACFENGFIKNAKKESTESTEAFDNPNIRMYIQKFYIRNFSSETIPVVYVIFDVKGEKEMYDMEIGNPDERECHVLWAQTIPKTPETVEGTQIAGDDAWSMYVKRAVLRALQTPPILTVKDQEKSYFAYRRVKKFLNVKSGSASDNMAWYLSKQYAYS